MFKKYYAYIAIFFIILCFGVFYASNKVNDISQRLIRFHVIANSDSTEDQKLKLKVRDSVLSDIGPKLELSKSKEESENILKMNLEEIKAIAQNEIAENGKNYDVSVVLGKSMFPTKMYSTIALPAGQYDALKVVIGNGEGKNWWCVMFPPLCFIDITRGITSEDTKNRLETVLDEDEYSSILNDVFGDRVNMAAKKPIISELAGKDDQFPKTQEKIEMRFKTVEVIQSLFDNIENTLYKNK